MYELIAFIVLSIFFIENMYKNNKEDMKKNRIVSCTLTEVINLISTLFAAGGISCISFLNAAYKFKHEEFDFFIVYSLIGFVAGTLTIICMLHVMYKLLNSKRVSEKISLTGSNFFIALILAFIFVLVYALRTVSPEDLVKEFSTQYQCTTAQQPASD